MKSSLSLFHYNYTWWWLRVCFSFWYRSLPPCGRLSLLSWYALFVCAALCDCLSTDFAGGQTDGQMRLSRLWGWQVVSDGGGEGRDGRTVASASQPLPSGDPDVRPWLLLDHCLYFVIDLFKAVSLHDSCSRKQDGKRKQSGNEQIA